VGVFRLQQDDEQADTLFNATVRRKLVWVYQPTLHIGRKLKVPSLATTCSLIKGLDPGGWADGFGTALLRGNSGIETLIKNQSQT
jgi:hypothetical protein